MTEVIWQEPPARSIGKTRKPGRLQLIAIELRKNPGRWALVQDGVVYSTVQPTFQGKQYERAYRNYVEDGKKLRRIYVRYIGEQQ